jgi:DNA-binding MarR family transcriptional regulator
MHNRNLGCGKGKPGFLLLHDTLGVEVDGALSDDAEEREWLLERARQARAEAERRERELLDERLDHLPFTLREASRAVDDVLSRLLDQDGFRELSLTTLHALVVARQGQPIVGIAHRLRVSPQAAGRAVRLLVDRGLATTYPSPMDARAKLVEPTPEGEELLLDLRRSLFVAVCLVDDDLRAGRLVALADELAALALLEPLGQ